MRRMITNKQVVDVVNKAIDDGEIEMEGGLPKIEAGDAGKVLKVNEQEDGVEWGEAGGADNALVLPEEAPASASAVIIDTTNTQQNIRFNTNSIDLYNYGGQTRLTTKCGLSSNLYFSTSGNYGNQTVPAGKIRCVLIAKGFLFSSTSTRGLWDCKGTESVNYLEKDIQALETAGLTIMGFITGAGTTTTCNELYAVVKNSTASDITVNLTGYHMYEYRGYGFGI